MGVRVVLWQWGESEWVCNTSLRLSQNAEAATISSQAIEAAADLRANCDGDNPASVEVSDDEKADTCINFFASAPSMKGKKKSEVFRDFLRYGIGFTITQRTWDKSCFLLEHFLHLDVLIN